VNRPGNPDVQLALYADYPTNRDLYPVLHEAFRAHPLPLLAVWGEHDEIFGPDGARAFSQDLPDAEVVLVDGAHFLLESHVDEVAARMTAFLAAHEDRLA
jgi:pimeloyl-ACP methyl ester carboxylesterase